MIYQPIAGADSGCDFFGCGVSHNPFTIFYSIYVGIWSTIFIESWHRRENELRFLWGSESLSQIEQPRPQFVGELHTNPETGRQVLEVKSPAMQYVKIILTTCASIAFILFTIASAVAAQMVRYIDVGMCVGTIAHQAVMVNGTDVAEGVDCHAAVEAGEFKLSQCDLTVGCEYVSPTSIWEQKKFEITSSVLNLTIIGVYGFLFEALADSKYTQCPPRLLTMPGQNVADRLLACVCDGSPDGVGEPPHTIRVRQLTRREERMLTSQSAVA